MRKKLLMLYPKIKKLIIIDSHLLRDRRISRERRGHRKGEIEIFI